MEGKLILLASQKIPLIQNGVIAIWAIIIFLIELY